MNCGAALISIIVPVYNAEPYLDNCLDSIAAQTWENLEVWLVDDGSTDRTGEIADGYAAQYPDIVRVIHKENGGHGSAVNAGLENAQGVYFKGRRQRRLGKGGRRIWRS